MKNLIVVLFAILLPVFTLEADTGLDTAISLCESRLPEGVFCFTEIGIRYYVQDGEREKDLLKEIRRGFAKNPPRIHGVPAVTVYISSAGGRVRVTLFSNRDGKFASWAVIQDGNTVPAAYAVDAVTTFLVRPIEAGPTASASQIANRVVKQFGPPG